MRQKTLDTPLILRYVYAMLAVVVVAATVVMGSLYLGQRDESRTRDEIQSLHLDSYVESDLLLDEALALRNLIVEATTSGDADLAVAAGAQSTQIDYRGLLGSMRARLKGLSAVQAQYEAGAIAATLERLITRFDRLDRELRGAAITPQTTTLAETYISTINQFRRLHTIAADDELRELRERQRERPRFLGVLLVCMGFATLAMWYLIKSLRASLIRQRESEAALAHTEERLHNVQKLDALAQLVGGVAHDFNNLLTAVLGQTELLAEKSTGNAGLQTGLNEIRTAGMRAAALTQQLLAFSRRQHADRSVLDLNEILRDMEVLVQRTLGDDIRLICTYAEDPYFVELDPGQFQQIMLNLVRNARDAMPEGGALGVITENVSISGGMGGVPDGEYLQLSVTDSGTGMDEVTRQRLFEPFFSTKEKGSGTGLGLSTVHGIVTDSNGYIAVDSKQGSGSEFRIYFPRSKKRPVAKPEQAPALTGSQKGSETVLVVDDDKQVLRFVESGLAALGYRVLTASNGTAGLDVCRQEPGAIHAIVSDVVMTGLNGPKFMAAALRLRPHAVAVYISAYTEEIILWRPNQQRKIPLVRKPFEMQVLAQVLRERLDEYDETGSSDGSAT